MSRAPAAPALVSARPARTPAGPTGDSERPADQLARDLADLEDDLGYDIDAWLPRAGRIEHAAEASGDVELQLRARLVRADVLLRRAETLAATPIILAVHTWAVAQDSWSVLERSHALLSRLHRVLGDPAASLEHAVCAVELLDESVPPRRRVDHLTKLADALALASSFDSAAQRYAQAERLAVTIGDVERQILVLNNLAYFACTAGEHELASTAAERLRAVAAADGRGLDQASSYLDTIAQVELALGRYAEAERTARAGIALHEAGGYDDAEAAAMFLLTLATAQRHLGRTGSAQQSLDRCRQLCEQRDLPGVRIRVQQEQAELHAACGELAAAFETYKAFHRADKALLSEQREARARTRQALFETTEARREADRFREQARRDALSGLWNRRYMDENLPTLIAEAGALGVPLVAAIIDLDHFKRINDRLSHETGDRVIVEVTGLLAGAVPTTAGSFCARLGGEEFLLVLTGTPLAQAVDRLEELRRTVAAHTWQHLTGDLPVTISVGVAVAGPHCNQSVLLGRADAALYAAKFEGRNQVCVDPEVPAERRRYRRGRPPASRN